MNCNSSHSFYLRSNGSLACWDDYGSLLTLQPYSAILDYARDVYLGPVYRTIRDRLQLGEMPFPEHCSRCYCLMREAPFDRRYNDLRVMDTFQVEPSMACQLECPGCIPIKERRQRVVPTPHGHLTLSFEVFNKILVDLHRAGVSVRKFDFQGHGEPLLNASTWAMCGRVAELYPGSINSICTNANIRFRTDMVRSGVNEMIFAIDGVDNHSYTPYRVHGKFDRAFAFMKSFSLEAAETRAPIHRVWKYVVFSHNDRPDQLLRAQELALEAGITELRFVLTQLGPVSGSVTHESHIPRLNPSLNVVVDNYRVTRAQLTAAIADLRAAIAAPDEIQARHWAEFLATMLYRLFRTAPEIPPEYRLVVNQLLELCHCLPRHLADEVRTRMTALPAIAPATREPEILSDTRAGARRKPEQSLLFRFEGNQKQRTAQPRATPLIDESSLPPPPAQFSLDRPQPTDGALEHRLPGPLRAGGWILAPPGSRLVAIEFRAGGQLLACATLNQMRPDVALAFPDRPEARWAGFYAEIPLDAHAGRRVALDVVARFGHQQQHLARWAVRVHSPRSSGPISLSWITRFLRAS